MVRTGIYLTPKWGACSQIVLAGKFKASKEPPMSNTF